MDISACFGDVQFPRWAHGAHAGQASLAMEQLPRVRQAIGFHSAVRHRGSILLLRLWGVQRALLSVLHLAAACYRTVRPRGHFNLLRFLGTPKYRFPHMSLVSFRVFQGSLCSGFTQFSTCHLRVFVFSKAQRMLLRTLGNSICHHHMNTLNHEGAVRI